MKQESQYCYFNFGINIIAINCYSFIDVPSINVTILTNKAELGRPYLLICSATSIEINFSYFSKFEWCHNGNILLGKNSRVLRLSPLSLSDVGNYTCKVTASSIVLSRPVHAESLPHVLILKGIFNKSCE